MTRRIPLIPTLIVGIAVAAMMALGFWQLLDRLPKKQAFLAQLAANPARPPIAFPRFPDDTLLFRRTTGFCLSPVSGRLAGAGAAGFRVIVECRTGVEGPGMMAQLGTTRDPAFKTAWTGGTLTGVISHAPDARSLIGSLFDRRAQRLMLVADMPPLGLTQGLTPNARPDLSSVPNNHLAYAVQWFIFAAIAAIIYAVALTRQQRTVVPARPQS